MSGAEGDPGMGHTSSEYAHGCADIEQVDQADNLKAWADRMREGMGRMANDEAERLKVAKRLS